MKKQISDIRLTKPISGSFRRAKRTLRFCCAAICIMATSAIYAQTSYNITTVAGNGTLGNTGDGAAATLAEVTPHFGVAVDGSGNLYIADANDNVIRKVNSSGIISRFAGTGTAGHTGDGGAATAATLNAPTGLAVDPSSSTLYVADAGNNCVRKIKLSSGVISAFAGTGAGGFGGDGAAATAAKLRAPVAVTADGAGNVYIADDGNNRIRQVSSGIITTYVGTGVASYTGDGGAPATATINDPTGVAIDAAGNNLYIADRGNNVIRLVSGGTISTFAGTGSTGFSGDGGSAAAATFNSCAGVGLDGSGNLYITDVGNNRLRQVVSGVIYSIAGNGGSGYAGDGGPALSAELQGPEAVTVDGSGNLFISDALNYRVRKCATVNTGVVAPSAAELLTLNTAEPFNTAMIHYAAADDSAIFAVAFAGTERLFLYDVGMQDSVSIADTNGNVPDIIIGNNPSNPRDYIIAVADHTTTAVRVTFYDVTGVGTGSLAVAYNSRTIFGGLSLTNDDNVHIDVVAENTGSGGLPNCNRFVITWAYDPTAGMAPTAVFATTGDIGTYFVNWSASVLIDQGSEPDVSAIEQTVGMSVDTIALITYVHNGNLMLAQYDFTILPATASICTLDNTANMIFHVPRIDANDDYTTNTTAGVANYKIAACAGYQPIWVGRYEVRTYDDLMGCTGTDYFASSGYFDLAGSGYPSYPDPYSHMSPVVAMVNPNQFAVFHWSTHTWTHNTGYISTDSTSDSAFAVVESIDASANYTLNPTNYYVVNDASLTPEHTGIVWFPGICRISISASENFNTADEVPVLYGYGYNSITQFKLSPSGSAYAFRQSPNTPAPLAENMWKVSPNPAASILTITNGTGVNAASNYVVTDILGRTLLHGSLAGSRTSVGLNTLASGVYLIELFNGEKSYGKTKFVKE